STATAPPDISPLSLHDALPIWILVENEKTCLYGDQPDYPVPADDPLVAEIQNNTGKPFWVYLDVWERHVTYLDVPGIRDVALCGDRKSTRLNSSHDQISYAVFC